MSAGINVFVGKNTLMGEGPLRGGWIELPQEPEDLRRFLVDVVGVDERDLEGEQDKVGLNGPFRIVDYEREGLAKELNDAGLRIGSLTSLEELNLLAGVDDYAYWDHDATLLALGLYPYDLDPVVCANYILQAGELDYHPFDDDVHSFCEGEGPEYRFGYCLARDEGLLNELAEKHAEHYFDFERYGTSRAREEGVVISDEGYLRTDRLPDDTRYDVEDIREMLGWEEEERAQWVDEDRPFEYLGCRPFAFAGETWVQLGDLAVEDPDGLAEYATDHGRRSYVTDGPWDLPSLRAAAEPAMTPSHLQGDFFLSVSTRLPYVAAGRGLVMVTPSDLRACGYHDAPGELERLIAVTNEALYFGGTSPVGNESLDEQRLVAPAPAGDSARPETRSHGGEAR